jgi:hypothetical protein
MISILLAKTGEFKINFKESVGDALTYMLLLLLYPWCVFESTRETVLLSLAAVVLFFLITIKRKLTNVSRVIFTLLFLD